MGELYGEINKLTMEWKDGLMAITVRVCVQVQQNVHVVSLILDRKNLCTSVTYKYQGTSVHDNIQTLRRGPTRVYSNNKTKVNRCTQVLPTLQWRSTRVRTNTVTQVDKRTYKHCNTGGQECIQSDCGTGTQEYIKTMRPRCTKVLTNTETGA